MSLQTRAIMIVILFEISQIYSQGIPISPCPKMFQYRFDGNEWYGLLSVRNPGNTQPLHLNVTLSLRDKPKTDHLGGIELLTRGQFQKDSIIWYKINFPKTNFVPKLQQIRTNNQDVCFGVADHNVPVMLIKLEHTRKITYINNDDTMPLTPSLTEPDVTNSALLPINNGFNTKHLLLKNNRWRNTNEICGTVDKRIQMLHGVITKTTTSVGDAGGSTTKNIMSSITTGAHLPRMVNNDDSNDDDDNDEILDGANIPTIVAIDTENVANVNIDGQTTTIPRGAWPWLAAIYVNNSTSLTYQCGGTLISARVVISAAHCFKMYKHDYEADDVLVFLGRHNLQNWNEEGSLAAPVDSIFIHRDFNRHLNVYDADIAVVILQHKVRFNAYIRPACMWSGPVETQYIEGEHGILIGWNLSQRKSSTIRTATIPRIISTPIVSNDVCFQANQKYRNLSSNRTFCAGNVHHDDADADGQVHLEKMPPVPCIGDSGGGLMLFKHHRWVLRGTVSAFPSDSASGCSYNQYVIYTDVAKFLDWITAFMI